MGASIHCPRLTGLLAIAASWAGAAAQASPGNPWHLDSQGRAQVDVHYDCSINAPTAALAAAGLAINASVKIGPLCVVEGWAATAAFAQINAVPGVARIKMPAYPSRIRPRSPALREKQSMTPPRSAQGSAQTQAASASAINSNAVAIMHAGQFVAQTGTGGAGVTVGVQSGGVSNVTVIQGRGELPAVHIVNASGSSGPSPGDEGTALLEEVHAVAPGAGLAFCGPDTFVEYASCLGQLIAAGATILIDDIVFQQEDLMSSDSSDVQAVEQVLAQNPNVALFTVSGNDNGSYWEGTYAPVSAASQAIPTPLSCPANGSTQTDNYVAQFNGSPSQQLTVSASSTFPLTFTWADPSGQNVSNFDVYWFSNSDGTLHGCYSTASSSETLLAQNLSLADGTYTLYVATPDASLAGKFLKLWLGGDGLTLLSQSTPGSVVSSQAFAAGAITIGAVNGSDGIGNSIEKFSSLGPITLPFPARTQIQAPVLVAPDGVNVDAAGTYFTSYLFPDGNFYGTSASVPNAGAVAALLRGAFPTMTVPQLKTALVNGATQLGGSSPDATFGYGRIDAMGALNTLPAPTITSLPNSTINGSVSSQSYPFTVTGTGNLHFSVTSSNKILIPPSIVAVGTPGVNIVPSTCGATTLVCSLSIMPANYQGDTVTVTVSAVDGANRSAPATMTVTVSNPNAPPVPTTPTTPTVTVTGNPSGGGGGGAIDWSQILALTLLAGLRIGRTRRIGGTPTFRGTDLKRLRVFVFFCVAGCATAFGSARPPSAPFDPPPQLISRAPATLESKIAAAQLRYQQAVALLFAQSQLQPRRLAAWILVDDLDEAGADMPGLGFRDAGSFEYPKFGVRAREFRSARNRVVLVHPAGPGPAAKFMASHAAGVLGLTVSVSNLRRATALIEVRTSRCFPTYTGRYGSSFLVPADLAEGTWIEIVQRSR
jgi:hypothetical protein